MNKKLLHKSTRHFLVYSVIILLISAPVFYLMTQKLYIDETDETLVLHKVEFLKFYNDTFTPQDIKTFNTYNRNIKIVADRGLAKDTLLNKIYFDALENEDEPYRELWAPVAIDGVKYTYIEKNNLIEMEDMAISTALLFLFVITVLLIGMMRISNRSSVKLWSPFYDTLNQIRGFEIDKNKTPQFAETNIEEFNTLNKSIAKLIEKNTIIYKNQKEFVENAAHELQTPLALFQSRIDTLYQLSVSKEQSHILDALNNDVARFNRLNKNLLLLSKIENTAALEKEEFDVNDFITRHLEFFTEQAKANNLSITTEFTAVLKIGSYRGLAEVMVNNLFLNAIRHNQKDGEVLITVFEKMLIFSNTGSHTLAADKLFKRFSKVNPSSKGNGLGLAIIKKIAALNDWEMAYSFQDGYHKFVVKF